jgi:hypothetical protein
VAATIAAATLGHPPGVAVFQPHRFTCTAAVGVELGRARRSQVRHRCTPPGRRGFRDQPLVADAAAAAGVRPLPCRAPNWLRRRRRRWALTVLLMGGDITLVADEITPLLVADRDG